MVTETSVDLKEEITLFFELHPPKQFGATLRSVLMNYLAKETRIGLPTEFGAFLLAMDDFFNLLDKAGQETGQ